MKHTEEAVKLNTGIYFKNISLLNSSSTSILKALKILQANISPQVHCSRYFWPRASYYQLSPSQESEPYEATFSVSNVSLKFDISGIHFQWTQFWNMDFKNASFSVGTLKSKPHGIWSIRIHSQEFETNYFYYPVISVTLTAKEASFTTYIQDRRKQRRGTRNAN